MAVASALSAPDAPGAPGASFAPAAAPTHAWAALTCALDLDAPAETAFDRLLTAAAGLTGAAGTRLSLGVPPGAPAFEQTIGDLTGHASRHASVPLTAAGGRFGTLDFVGADPQQISGVAAVIATLISLVMDNAALREAQSRDQDQTSALATELANARKIQRDLLPRDADGPFPLHGINRPARVLSGDFFDYLTLPDGTIPFTLGDVSGKGLNAALLMAKTASLFRLLAKTEPDPSRLLTVINHELAATASGGMFVTMVAGTYQPATGEVRFANAGHEPPLVRWPDRSYQSYPAAAPPLGILPEIPVQTTTVHLAGGEFFIFSDGLTEGSFDGIEQLGVEGLIQMIEVHADLALPERTAAVLADLDGDGWDVHDDLTMLAIDDAIAGTAR